MNLCDSGHQEVCYEGRTCPACAAIEDKDADIAKLESRISTLEDELASVGEETL